MVDRCCLDRDAHLARTGHGRFDVLDGDAVGTIGRFKVQSLHHLPFVTRLSVTGRSLQIWTSNAHWRRFYILSTDRSIAGGASVTNYRLCTCALRCVPMPMSPGIGASIDISARNSRQRTRVPACPAQTKPTSHPSISP